MAQFRAAHAVASDWRTAARSCIDQLSGVPHGATLGFVYASDPLSEALDLIVRELRRGTGIEAWVGSGGAGVCACGFEHMDEGALAILVAPLPAADFRIFGPMRTEGRAHARLADWARTHAARLGVVHADAREPRLAETVAGLAEGCGIFLVGGLNSSRTSALQIAGSAAEGGLSGVVFAAGVPAVTAMTQGCAPIGPVREIGACQDVWVQILDGRPALDVLKEDIGELLARQLDRLAGYIFAALPVSGADRPDYLVRNLLAVDPKRKAIALGASVRRGDPLLFVRRDGAAARADLRRMLDDVRRRSEGRPIRGALYHACVARGSHLFGPGAAELAMIQDAIGPVPLAGFFANGEIFHNRLYAYTGVLTLFL